jgi:DNA-binding protein WhiA
MIRLSKRLGRSFKKFLKKSLPDTEKIEIAGCRFFFPEIRPVDLRRKFVARFQSLSRGGSSSKHCQISFMQGLFFAHGYVQNPGRGYHLEIRLRSRWLVAAFKKNARFLKMRFSYFQKGGYHIFYTKSSRQIIKFLNKLGLFEKALELSDFIATRSLLSMVNRQVNSETGNINRLVSAAEKTIAHIQQLFEYQDQDFWTDTLRETALIRLKFPHDSIEKLGARFQPPLTKSAVNHRLRRINAIYTRLFPSTSGENENNDQISPSSTDNQ